MSPLRATGMEYSHLAALSNKKTTKVNRNYFFGGLVVMKVVRNLQSEDTPIG
jgi:hypothetical protein